VAGKMRMFGGREGVFWVCLFLGAAGFLSGTARAQEGKKKSGPEGLLWPPGWVERVLKEAILAHPGENVVFSPLQVKLDLTLFRKFALKKSREKIDRFFGIRKGSEDLEFQKKILLPGLQGMIRDKDFGFFWRLSMSCRAVPGPGTVLREDFLQALRGIQVGPPPERKEKLKVPPLRPGDLAWVSRLEFGAAWRETFISKKDEKGRFFSFRPGVRYRRLPRGDPLGPGAWKDVVFLRYPGGRPCGYTGNLLYQAVSLELRRGFTFVVVLPREWKGLLPVLDKIGLEGRKRALRLEPMVMVDLFLPKFRAVYEDVQFLSVLERSGLFEEGEPLSLLASKSKNYLAAYLVSAGIEVEEMGIKGFSASLLVGMACATNTYEVVKVDRPFLFYVFPPSGRDDPLLAGAVFDPGEVQKKEM